MIHPVDITPDRLDITALWHRLTGDRVACALAHLRAGRVVTVTVCDGPRLAMDRAGAAALITPQVVEAIESTARAHPAPA